jgi:hypothetical protein
MDSTDIFWVILYEVTASCKLRRNSVTDKVFFLLFEWRLFILEDFFSQINFFTTGRRETFHFVHPNEEFSSSRRLAKIAAFSTPISASSSAPRYSRKNSALLDEN